MDIRYATFKKNKISLLKKIKIFFIEEIGNLNIYFYIFWSYILCDTHIKCKSPSNPRLLGRIYTSFPKQNRKILILIMYKIMKIRIKKLNNKSFKYLHNKWMWNVDTYTLLLVISYIVI